MIASPVTDRRPAMSQVDVWPHKVPLQSAHFKAEPEAQRVSETGTNGKSHWARTTSSAPPKPHPLDSKSQFSLQYFMAFISSFTYLSSALFGGSAGKESACNVGDVGLIPGWGRSAGEGKGYSLQYSCLENSMDCIVHGVTKSQIRLSDFNFHYLVNKYHLTFLYHLKIIISTEW